MIRKSLLALALVPFMAAFAGAESHLLRTPTYSRGRVAFSYLGDIWIANDNGSAPQRLTDHEARDIYPRFSPDGNWIAFSSNRNGNYDVYVMPAQGGKPRQLTFNSADDTVVGWTPDGTKVLFFSSRGKGVYITPNTLFEVSLEGGLETFVDTGIGTWASYSPDGSRLAFNRGGPDAMRKHVRSSLVSQIWVMNTAAKTFVKLGDGDYKGNYLWPMYGRNGEIYFVADRLPNEKNIVAGSAEVIKSANNVWKISERGGTPVQVTHHTSGNLFYPSISSDGKTIVYEENFELWKLDTASGKSVKIPIDIKSDVKGNEKELRAFVNEAESFDLSPSGKRAAISVHGEIFTVATERGEIQRVTESPWRDQFPRWSPDGKWIAYISDRTGREEVWISDELGRKAKQVSDGDCDKATVVWAPDSKSLLWSGSDFKLRLSEIETGKTEIVASSDFQPIVEYEFSPDGKWISYSKGDSLQRLHVYVKQLGSTEEHKIGGDQFPETSHAKWTSDGKKLLLLGAPPATPSLNSQLFAFALIGVNANPGERHINTEEEAQALTRRTSPANPAANTSVNSGDSKVEVKIEWDGLDRRMRQLSCMGSFVAGVWPSPDGRTYLFAQAGGLFTMTDDATRLTRINAPAIPASVFFGGGRLEWSRDNRTIFYLNNGLSSVAIPPVPATEAASNACPPPAATGQPITPKKIEFTVRVEIDHAMERRQIFEEAWRVMKNRYYNPDMNGIDWAAAKETYAPLLADVADSDELRAVILQMIGEMNSSHTGMSAPTPSEEEQIQTQYPGFELEPDSSGFYRVGHIFRNGPADHDYLKLKSGDYILSVNGKELKSGENYWEFFNVLPGRTFDFTLNSRPVTDGSWHIEIDPIAPNAQRDLDYQRWVDNHKKITEQLSNNEIGYLHIRAMDGPSLAQFQRDLFENRGKKALVIDERFNNGGNTEQQMLQILSGNRVDYGTLRPRNSVDVPRAGNGFFGPMVVLQNERSVSDGEMFPQGFRALGLGKLVGVTTPGWVIWTGTYQLIDRSTMRTPMEGAYGANGENLENHGVQPDVFVDNTPEDFIAGRDRQLEKAIAVLRSEMAEKATTGESGSKR